MDALSSVLVGLQQPRLAITNWDKPWDCLPDIILCDFLSILSRPDLSIDSSK